MASEMNPSKIQELMGQLKNTNYPGKSQLMATLQSLVDRMGIAKSVEDALWKSANDADCSKVISQAISYFVGAGKDEPQADIIAAGLRMVLLSENIKAIKSCNMRNKADVLKRLQAQFDDAQAAAVAKSEPATITNAVFDAMRKDIRDGPGSRYKKFTQHQFVDAFEKRAGTTPTKPDEAQIAYDLVKSAGWGDKALDVINKRYEDEAERAEFDRLPDSVKKSLEDLKNATASEFNEFANALGVDIQKDVSGKQNVPVVDSGSWSGAEAEKKLEAWASDSDGNVDYNKLKQAYLWSAPNPTSMADLKFPIMEPSVSGHLVVNRDALSAAAQRLNSAKDIPDNEIQAMKATLRRYYTQIGVSPENHPKSIQKSSPFIGRRTVG
jgi:hypothetical protein